MLVAFTVAIHHLVRLELKHVPSLPFSLQLAQKKSGFWGFFLEDICLFMLGCISISGDCGLLYLKQ